VVALPLVVAVGWALVDSTSFAEVFVGQTAVLLVPAVVLLCAGIVVIRRLARGAEVLDRDVGTLRSNRGRASRICARIAGKGGVVAQTVRLGGCAALFAAIVLAIGSPSTLVLGACLVAIAAAASWPMLERRSRRIALDDAARSGLVELLELSVALVSAGSNSREVSILAATHCPNPLREELAPALAQIELGREPSSAFGATEIVADSPELLAWCATLNEASATGVPVSDALENQLRDARSERAERVRTRAAAAAPRIHLAIVLLIVPAIMWVMLVASIHGLVDQLAQVGVIA
jgi:Flp pilus assembly protein TadB